MKFLEQVQAYQRALTRKSQFFGALMLASGIGLVAAAPFLSYEMSKIECYEKGTAPAEIGDSAMVIQKYEWERKNQKIENLEDVIQNKDERIEDLIEDSNCDEVIEVIKKEKEELIKIQTQLKREIKIVEKDRDKIRERLIACENGNNSTNNGQDCNKLRTEYKTVVEERDLLIEQLAECNEKKEILINGSSDCSDIETKLNACEGQLAENKEVIAGLEQSLRTCESGQRISIFGTFHYKETFSLNKDEFKVSLNLSDDPEFMYDLEHNGRIVTKKFKVEPTNGQVYYNYRDNSTGKRYRINFGRAGDRSVSFRLASV